MDVKKEEYGMIDLGELLDSSMDASTYQYFLGLKNNELLITTEIGEDAIERYVMPLIRMDSDPTVPEITVYVSTPGGDIFNGMLICDVLSKVKTKTKIIILSQACSMGGLIAMAGFKNDNVKTYCYPFSYALVHGGQLHIGGTKKVFKDTQKFIDTYEEKMRTYILEHSKISDAKLKEKEDDEWFITADELVEYGIVDEII